ncbi:MAG: hypothetical protein WBA31_02615 [Candidatus Dormiibacterota bacterium]
MTNQIGATPSGAIASSMNRRLAASKVPRITAYFWIVKILTTAMGEATADYLDHRLVPVIAVLIAGLALVAALVWQFSVRRYFACIYWLVVVLVAVFGTMAADGLHYELGFPYILSTLILLLVLGVVFWSWYRSEKTLSIHSIHTPRREAFYWITVMATFALGTAAGDLTANTLGLGYLGSAVLFAVAITLPGLAHWKLRLDPILAFWIAYVLTRPLGASVADWVGVPRDLGGLGWGRGTVSIIFSVAIAILVAYLARTGKDDPSSDATPAA